MLEESEETCTEYDFSRVYDHTIDQKTGKIHYEKPSSSVRRISVESSKVFEENVMHLVEAAIKGELDFHRFLCLK